jgi:hypothetical protein
MTEGLLDGKRVLIVDDEPDILEALKDLLPIMTRSSVPIGRKRIRNSGKNFLIGIK